MAFLSPVKVIYSGNEFRFAEITKRQYEVADRLGFPPSVRLRAVLFLVAELSSIRGATWDKRKIQKTYKRAVPTQRGEGLAGQRGCNAPQRCGWSPSPRVGVLRTSWRFISPRRVVQVFVELKELAFGSVTVRASYLCHVRRCFPELTHRRRRRDFRRGCRRTPSGGLGAVERGPYEHPELAGGGGTQRSTGACCMRGRGATLRL